MGKIVKFTVSMPARDFKELEERRRKAKQTRSQFVREALGNLSRRSPIPGPPGVREDGTEYGPGLPPDLTPLEVRRQRALEAAGRFRSGTTDLSAEHDKYLGSDFIPGRTPDGGHKKRGRP